MEQLESHLPTRILPDAYTLDRNLCTGPQTSELVELAICYFFTVVSKGLHATDTLKATGRCLSSDEHYDRLLQCILLVLLLVLSGLWSTIRRTGESWS